MKILHTADWHLGASLGQGKRYEESEKALDFLLKIVRDHSVRCMIIAGDVFDSPVPPNRAVEQYYHFLVDGAAAGLRDIIVIAGNHDSPGFLEAPGELLKRLRVHVYGYVRADLGYHLVPLTDGKGKISAVVAALPFLHDRDVREFKSGESFDEHLDAFRAGVLARYREICALAVQRYPGVPLIATGHFFATGRKDPEPGASALVGMISDIPTGAFPKEIDYMAMGHLHAHQKIGGRENFRYCGSLYPVAFHEAGTERGAVLIDTDSPRTPEFIPLPVFQELATVCGTMEEIHAALNAFRASGKSVWLRIENTGPFQPRLREDLAAVCAGAPLTLISCRNREPNPAVLRRAAREERLNELNPEEVFLRFLAAREIEGDEKRELLDAFRNTVSEMEQSERAGKDAAPAEKTEEDA